MPILKITEVKYSSGLLGFTLNQNIPTKNDIEVIRNLAEKLRGTTDAETLNNVLEWQERNIIYWTERFCLRITYNAILLVSYLIYLLALVLPLIFRSQPSIADLGISLVLWFLGFIASFLCLLSISKFLTETDMAIRASSIAIIFYLSVTVPSPINLVLLILSSILLFIVLYLFFINYYMSLRQRINLRRKLRETYELIAITLMFSPLPLEKMLKYKKGTCVDYAKITIALLMNLYQNNNVRIYLLGTLNHSAAGDQN